MAVDQDTVRKVARLARLAVAEDRLEPMTRELNAILRWIEQLNEVDVTGGDPMTSTVEAEIPMREDAVADGPTGGGQADAVLANAPRAEDRFFVVPKVVE